MRNIMRISQQPRRLAFTIVELLVVIAIISVLASLVAAGIWRFIGGQQQSTTELTMRKLNNSVRSQWDAVVAKAKTEQIPDGIIAMAGGNTRLAQVIWLKYKVKLYFPNNFGEAQTPFPAKDAGGNVNPFTANVPTTSPYRTDMSTLGFGNATSSGAFLLLALSKRISGSPFNVDDMGAGAVGDVNGVRQFIDAWGNPLVFYRWVTVNQSPPPPMNPPSPPTPANIVGDLDASFPGKAAARYRDPLDPQGLLLNPVWNSLANYQNKLGVYWFEQIFHPVHDLSAANWTPQALYLVPVISSAGPNGVNGDEDDLWSFRLRIGAKGDQ